MKKDEDTSLKIYYTDRQGVPVAIDITGKEGIVKFTDNSNFFALGPSGSGKSFNMNSVVRQLLEQNTDVVMVDTGNSYEGICSFFQGTYISYTAERPITMNPFNITKEEDNLEKRDFLTNLIILIWKGSDSTITQAETKIIRMVISQYFATYFTGGQKLTEQEINQKISALRVKLNKEANEEKKYEESLGHEVNVHQQQVKIELYLKQEQESLLYVDDYKIEELSFNSFYEFAKIKIPVISEVWHIPFNIHDFLFILADFYKGGEYERTLNNQMDTSLFNEKFIVFEIDAIKDNKLLFPIVTLIIMDLFIQKMRIKKNRKALIIEEAWKALASDLMADYIKYLYKTVRKFWGIVGVVTQELDDIIQNKVVKDAIINNSDITILLDQSKFKERYDDIARLLGLSEVECRKIWTINSLDNKDNRAFFREVYIRRGVKGDVFGVEEPPECYMAYTTERAEKDGLKLYIEKYKDIRIAIEHFCADWKASKHKSAMQFVRTINKDKI
ncbi:hypothetical protein FACS189446_1520 [Bacteroidia bacterium]|nr:hypothetical protein FACS189446_1520 [Bacteroidia bacterium]